MQDPTIIHDKKSLRDEARLRRGCLSARDIEEKSVAICARALFAVRDVSPVMVYASKAPEVATGALIDALIADGKKVVVPIIEQETCSLRLSYLEDPQLLVESTFKVPEPIGHE